MKIKKIVFSIGAVTLVSCIVFVIFQRIKTPPVEQFTENGVKWKLVKDEAKKLPGVTLTVCNADDINVQTVVDKQNISLRFKNESEHNVDYFLESIYLQRNYNGSWYYWKEEPDGSVDSAEITQLLESQCERDLDIPFTQLSPDRPIAAGNYRIYIPFRHYATGSFEDEEGAVYAEFTVSDTEKKAGN